MKLGVPDIAVLIPLVPLLPIVVTWWLPWEKWIPWKRIPKHILGPYLLYAAFAEWYFKMPWWCIAIAAVLGLVVSGIAIREFNRRYRRPAT